MSGPISLEIRLSREKKIFHKDEAVEGIVIIRSKTECRHDGLILSLDGGVQMQAGVRATGIIESAFAGQPKPIRLVSEALELLPPGRLEPGEVEKSFSLPLKPKTSLPLYETYHGVFLAVQYSLRAILKRSFPNKSAEKRLELVLQQREGEGEPGVNKPQSFTLSPDSVVMRERGGKVPKFLLKGKLDSSSCLLGRPLTGEVSVEESSEPLKSLEVQLLRVETCGSGDAAKSDATELQTIQLGDGDLPRGLPIPIFMVFPRLFCAPSTDSPNFRLHFQLNLILLFHNDYEIKESFPITLHRH